MSDQNAMQSLVSPPEVKINLDTNNNNKYLKLSDLFNKGSLIFLKVSMWSGTTKISASDLGINETENIRNALTLGSEKLIPKELLQTLTNIRTTAHQYIDQHSVKFDFYGKFVPTTQKESLTILLDALKSQFYPAVDLLIANYENIMTKQLDVLNVALMEATKHLPNQQVVVENAINRIRGKYPNSKVLKDKFAFSYKFRGITMPTDGKQLSSIEKAEKESEFVDETCTNIVKEYAVKVEEKLQYYRNILLSGGKLTKAAINSVDTLRDELEKLKFFGCMHLVKSLDSLLELLKFHMNFTDKENNNENLDKTVNGILELENNLQENINNSIGDFINNLKTTTIDI